jgi:hypothetical protein
MTIDVTLFIDGIHFGLAIKCADGWYKFEYAAGGASGVSSSSASSSGGSSNSNAAVTIKRSAPTGTEKRLGQTAQGLSAIIEYARKHCGFDGSHYALTDNNCRQFCAALADFMGLSSQYDQASKGYFFRR